MTDIYKLIRNNIASLKPYSSARDEFSGSKGIFLDANENPFGKLNRYPDPHQKKLKAKLAAFKSVSPDTIFIGNGSDEIIDLTYRIFCNPGIDKALTFSPTYAMYQVSADINDISFINLPLNKEFQINITQLDEYIIDPLLKIIFICSPNNPTGNAIEGIDYILERFKGIVFIDEAYIDFSTTPSWIEKISQYPNLIVSQTFSKAWGLAAARVGIAYASAEIISWFNKIKSPYNVSALNQRAAIKAMKDTEKYDLRKQSILLEKRLLQEKLIQFPFIIKIYPSNANFLLVRCSDPDQLYNRLLKEKVITRNRNSVISGCIRITVGSPEENLKLLIALKKIHEKSIIHK